MAKAKQSKKEQVVSFQWKGTNHKGVKESGELEARNAQVARMMLRQKGIKITKLKKEAKDLFGGKQVKNRDVVIIT